MSHPIPRGSQKRHTRSRYALWRSLWHPVELLVLLAILGGLTRAQTLPASLTDMPLGALLLRASASSPYIAPSPAINTVNIEVARTALMSIQQTYLNNTGGVVEALYLLPLPPAATNPALSLNGHQMAGELRANGSLFRVDLGKLAAGEQVQVHVTFTQPPLQVADSYSLAVPLTAEGVTSLTVRLNRGVLELLESRHHDVQVLQQDGVYTVMLKAVPGIQSDTFELRWQSENTTSAAALNSAAGGLDATFNSFFSFAAFMLSSLLVYKLLGVGRRHRHTARQVTL